MTADEILPHLVACLETPAEETFTGEDAAYFLTSEPMQRLQVAVWLSNIMTDPSQRSAFTLLYGLELGIRIGRRMAEIDALERMAK